MTLCASQHHPIMRLARVNAVHGVSVCSGGVGDMTWQDVCAAQRQGGNGNGNDAQQQLAFIHAMSWN